MQTKWLPRSIWLLVICMVVDNSGFQDNENALKTFSNVYK